VPSQATPCILTQDRGIFAVVGAFRFENVQPLSYGLEKCACICSEGCCVIIEALILALLNRDIP